MEHSVKEIAKRYSEISQQRGDRKLFKYDGFLIFAGDNIEKYSLIDNDADFLVSSWYVNDLINDYRKTLSMPLQEVQKMADERYEGCDGCTEFEEKLWKEGFVAGYYKCEGE